MATKPLTDAQLKDAVEALKAAGGNQIRAAAALGMSRTTFQCRLREAERRGFSTVEDPGVLAIAADGSYRSFATVRQGEILDAVFKSGSVAKAADELGITAGDIQRSVQDLKRRASVRGYSPEHDYTRAVPETHVAKGVSTAYNGAGEISMQWVKSDLRQEAYNALVKAAISEFISEVPQLPCAPEPLDFQSDIIPWIQIGDAHVGMLAHAAETTENFDLKIAERELCGSIAQLIDEMPPCERLVVNDLGDFTHYENMKGETEASGHKLDYDGRFGKMIKVYSRVMRFIIDRCLTKAKFVDVIINQGNHSRVNDIWMRELINVAYGHTGRVHALENTNVFIGYRMGNTLVMVHHSDKCPPARLIGVMTSDFRRDFGETQFHYIDIGHVHHHFVSKEHPSVVIESWNHLASNDKWAHDAGYRSRKSITVVLRSRTYGEVGRRLLPIEEIRARLAKAVGGEPQPAAKKAYAV